MASIDSLTVCNTRQARNFIIRALQAGNVPFLTSSPGMGKSAIIRSVAEEFGMKLIDHRLSTSAPEDLSGLPFRNGDRAEFIPFADLFPIEGDEIPEGYNGWLLFLDEFNSARKEVVAAAYKLILDRMTGQKKLHPNVMIICAGNKATDRAIVNPLGTAMQSRVVHFEMELNFDIFVEDVMIPQEWDERLVAFLHANPGYLHDFDPAHKNKTFCCPRTWDFVNKDLKNRPEGALPDEDSIYYAGHVTAGKATEFVQFTQVYNRMITIEKVVKDPLGCALPEDNNLCWATVNHLANKTTEENFSDVLQYIERFKTFTHKILYFRTVGRALPELQATPEWRKAAANISRYIHG
ncbi:ATP-binding protein [Escherichia phage UE-S5b]